jgi:glycosyltransferase involved in cell wall biosynthesis
MSSNIKKGGNRTRGYIKKKLPNKPLVSVITVVFNGETYLRDTIHSVINQTYDNVEYIVIDGGSTDKTVDIIRSHDESIDYWVSERDTGIYDAMNKGIMASKGDIIGILNADDYYEKNTCEIVVEYFRRDPDLLLVHGAMRRINTEGKTDSIYGSKKNNCDIFMAPYNHPTCFFHVMFYKKYGLFDKHFFTAADYDLMLRFNKAKIKHKYADRVLTNFRMVGITSTSKMFPWRQIWKILRKNGYSVYKCCLALGYRMFRLILSKVFDYLKIKKWLRQFISYHEKVT